MSKSNESAKLQVTRTNVIAVCDELVAAGRTRFTNREVADRFESPTSPKIPVYTADYREENAMKLTFSSLPEAVQQHIKDQDETIQDLRNTIDDLRAELANEGSFFESGAHEQN
ncbi:hypothetical protein [Sphaerothrix gracilis]|uniref:hypothetical protein n=1 Tax=Sphaerothrix gracilis TaxID=3151835 RepID=UPI0031FBC414